METIMSKNLENERFGRLAIENGKELVRWNELDEEEKREVMDNLDKYLVTFS